MTTFCKKMKDGFWFIAVVAEAILMLANLMQVSIQVTFAKSKPAHDDLGEPGWVEVFDLGGDRFFH